MDYLLTAHRFADNMCVIFKAFVIFFLGCFVLINYANSSDWQSEIAEVETLITQAKSAGGLWRDTEKLLEQAKEFQTNGNLQEAYASLHKAKQQAELGHQQAAEQVDNLLIPYYLKH